MKMSMHKVLVVVPNWNGEEYLQPCLDSLRGQSLTPYIVMVDNGSTDGSVAFVEARYPEVEIIRHDVNKGYAGGVNPGFRRAIELDIPYTAPFNNDAVADKDWLKELVQHLDTHPEVGFAAAKFMNIDGTHLDSTGDQYTIWGLPYPRGRGEADTDAYDHDQDILGASGGSSLFRIATLQEIGLMDEDFFAYYEDVDLSLRAQLAGWKIHFVPKARVYHRVSATSSKINGFFTLQTVKNYPWILIKNIPGNMVIRVLPRFTLAYCLLIGRATQRGHIRWVAQGFTWTLLLVPRKLRERRRIQTSRKVLPAYLWAMMTHDLPPNANALRALRRWWWRATGRM